MWKYWKSSAWIRVKTNPVKNQGLSRGFSQVCQNYTLVYQEFFIKKLYVEFLFHMILKSLVLNHIKANQPNVLIIFSEKDSCLLDISKFWGPTWCYQVPELHVRYGEEKCLHLIWFFIMSMFCGLICYCKFEYIFCLFHNYLISFCVYLLQIWKMVIFRSFMLGTFRTLKLGMFRT